jgi:hypothetical protein
MAPIRKSKAISVKAFRVEGRPTPRFRRAAAGLDRPRPGTARASAEKHTQVEGRKAASPASGCWASDALDDGRMHASGGHAGRWDWIGALFGADARNHLL